MLWEALIGRRLIAPGDGLRQYLPWYVTAARSWQSGHLPSWNPFSFSGYPLLGSQQAAVFYPPNFLFALLPPLIAFNLTVVMSIVAAALGAWLLARHLTKNYFAATVAAVAFGFSGFMWGHIEHAGIIATAAWLPWILFGFELVKERLSPWRLLVASGAVALSALAGHPQIFLQNLLALAVYSAISTLVSFRETKGRPFGVMILVVLAGIALSLVQLLPTARVFAEGTPRSKVSYDFAMQYSFPASHGPLITFPFLFGTPHSAGPYEDPYKGKWNLTELSGYPGLAAAALAAVGLSALRRERAVRAVAGMGAVGLLLAFGRTTPLSRLLFEVPIYGQLRSWGRYISIFDLAIAILAAFGVKRLIALRGRERRVAARASLALAIFVTILAAICPLIPAVRRFLPGGRPAVPALLIPLAAAWVGATLAYLQKMRLHPWQWTVVTVLLFDSFLSFSGFYEWRSGVPSLREAATLLHPAAPFTWGRVKDARGGIDRYTFVGPVWSADWTHMTELKRVRSTNGIDPLAPLDYVEALKIGPDGSFSVTRHLWDPESDLLDLLRVTTLIAVPGANIPSQSTDSLFNSPATTVRGNLSRYVYEPRLPDAFLVGQTITRTRSEVLKAIRGVVPFDPSRSALIEERCRACPRGPRGRAGEVTAEYWDMNAARFTIEADRPALLVLSQAWSSGWTAYVDGIGAPVLRVNGVVQGVPLGKGKHEVHLQYRSPGLRAGTIATTGTLLLFLISMIWTSVRRTRGSK